MRTYRKSQDKEIMEEQENPRANRGQTGGQESPTERKEVHCRNVIYTERTVFSKQVRRNLTRTLGCTEIITEKLFTISNN